MLPACPYLPAAREGLDWRALHAHRDGHRGEEFYRACLEYAQVQWRKKLPARALLCLDRAMGAELRGDEPVLQELPMPYYAMGWLITHAPPELFLGNPRVHFQHYADRMNEPRREQRRWRAWACWAITRVVRPELPGDPRHRVVEPSEGQIFQSLHAHAHPGEAEFWRAALKEMAAWTKPDAFTA